MIPLYYLLWVLTTPILFQKLLCKAYALIFRFQNPTPTRWGPKKPAISNKPPSRVVCFTPSQNLNLNTHMLEHFFFFRSISEGWFSQNCSLGSLPTCKSHWDEILQVGGDHRTPTQVLKDEQRRSFVGFLPRTLSCLDFLFPENPQVFGRPRKVVFWGW